MKREEVHYQFQETPMASIFDIFNPIYRKGRVPLQESRIKVTDKTDSFLASIC